MQWGLCSLANASVKHLVCVFLGLAALCMGNMRVGLINMVKVYEQGLTVGVRSCFS